MGIPRIGVSEIVFGKAEDKAIEEEKPAEEEETVLEEEAVIEEEPEKVTKSNLQFNRDKFFQATLNNGKKYFSPDGTVDVFGAAYLATVDLSTNRFLQSPFEETVVNEMGVEETVPANNWKTFNKWLQQTIPKENPYLFKGLTAANKIHKEFKDNRK